MRLRLGLFWLLLSSAVSAGAIERLTLAASPVSSFAPANLVVRVHVTPDPANRALEVIAESSERGIVRRQVIVLASAGGP